jgi:hypothetical protein
MAASDPAPLHPEFLPEGDNDAIEESTTRARTYSPSSQFSIVVGALAEAEDRLATLPRTDEVRALRKRFQALQRVSVDTLTGGPASSETESAKLITDVIALATDVLRAGQR